jgi:predicted metalloprotease with PDZ domain
MRRCTLVLFALCASAQAADYEISFDAATSSANVRVTLSSGGASVFRMPAWSPGDYRIVDYGRHISDLKFTRNGATIASSKKDANTWQIEGEADSVSYRVATQRAGIFSENFRLASDEVFVHGPAVFGYFDGRKHEAQRLLISPYPREGSTVAIGLAEREPYKFEAKSYDELIDSPFAMGTGVRIVDFTFGARRHQVAAFGPQGRNASPAAYVPILTKIVEQGQKMFGELPYEKYVFLMDFGGDGGGLEHANSARLAMWLGDPADAAGFLAHEYFHAFNVKRIRSKPLGPFDYTKPAVTGALWWLEGVTDYYAEVFLVRAGITTREQAMRSLSSELRAFSRDADRLRVGADESSRRVWEVKNSSGYGINYYTKGKLIGWVLDLAIRSETQGKKSLDDVMKALYAETSGDKPGFAETRIRELCVKIGGPALATIYDDCVIKAVELPISSILGSLGMTLSEGIVRDDPAARNAVGQAWPH